MLGLSQTTRYGLRALGCVQGPGCICFLIRDIAKSTGVPKPYLAKIITLLSRKGIVLAKRGHRGGIVLARPAKDISLLEVVEALEGKGWVADCLLGLDHGGGDRVCPTHAAWQNLREQIKDLLRKITLADLPGDKTPPPIPPAKEGELASPHDSTGQKKPAGQTRRRRRGFAPLGWPAP
jgi:Rrf2 family protein